MILQENKYLKAFSGISRDIIYVEKENLVKIYFHFVENEHLCITFQKKYTHQEEALNEIKTFIEQEHSNMEENNPKTDHPNDIKAFINAIQSHQIPLPNSDYQLQGDINYLLSAITEKNKQ